MMTIEYKHYKNFPKAKWRWPDFSPRELRSKGDNRLMVDDDAMDKLQRLRNLIGQPMRLTSAYRSPAHNKTVGGAKSSQHLLAKAFDVQMEGHNPAQFEAAARDVGFTGFGFYGELNFMHIDTGPEREWNDRWFTKVLFYAGNIPTPDMAEVERDFDDVTFELPPTPKKNVKATPVALGIGGVIVLAAAFFSHIRDFIGGLF